MGLSSPPKEGRHFLYPTIAQNSMGGTQKSFVKPTPSSQDREWMVSSRQVPGLAPRTPGLPDSPRRAPAMSFVRFSPTFSVILITSAGRARLGRRRLAAFPRGLRLCHGGPAR